MCIRDRLNSYHVGIPQTTVTTSILYPVLPSYLRFFSFNVISFKGVFGRPPPLCCCGTCLFSNAFITAANRLSSSIFTARCTIVQSAVLRSHVVRPSVRPSVCNVGGSGPHRLEILETNCTDNTNTFALRSPKAIHLLKGEHREIWGRLEVGWGKVARWSTKQKRQSLKGVKVEEKLLWIGGPIGTHQCSFEQYHPRPPMASSSRD